MGDSDLAPQLWRRWWQPNTDSTLNFGMGQRVVTKVGLEPGISTLDSVGVTGGKFELLTSVLDRGVPNDLGLSSRSPNADKIGAPLGSLEPLTSTWGDAVVANLGLELVTSNCATGGKTSMGL